MIVEIPIAYQDKPNLNGYYLSKEVYLKALNNYTDNHPVSVRFQNSPETIGECIEYNLENNTAKINITNLPWATEIIEKCLVDKYLGYRLVADKDDITVDENGNKVILGAKLAGFDIIDYPAYTDNDELYKSIREFVKQQEPMTPEEYQKLKNYLKSDSVSLGVNVFDYMNNEDSK